MAKEPKILEPNMFVHSSSGSFTTMRNYHLRDTSISLKACGLLSKMLSLPPDWNFTIEGLASLTRDGRDSVNAAIKELKEHGYISTSPKYGTDGRFCGVRYDIYESPHPENPDTVSPDTEKPNTENPQVLNTNKFHLYPKKKRISPKDFLVLILPKRKSRLISKKETITYQQMR